MPVPHAWVCRRPVSPGRAICQRGLLEIASQTRIPTARWIPVSTCRVSMEKVLQWFDRVLLLILYRHRVHVFEKLFCEIILEMCQEDSQARILGIQGNNRTRRRPTGLTTTVSRILIYCLLIMVSGRNCKRSARIAFTCLRPTRLTLPKGSIKRGS